MYGEKLLHDSITNKLVATGIISDPSESGILPWLGVILSYTFNGFWVLPIFWISKPINSIWFQVSFGRGGGWLHRLCSRDHLYEVHVRRRRHFLALCLTINFVIGYNYNYRTLLRWCLMNLRNSRNKLIRGMYLYVHLILRHCVKISHPCRSAVDSQPLSQLISRLIADFLFSVVMEALFLFQVTDCNTLAWLVKTVT